MTVPDILAGTLLSLSIPLALVCILGALDRLEMWLNSKDNI